METINPASLQSQYDDLMAKVNNMKPYLDLLYRDYMLITTKEINFIYAVDFHEIWNFAEPLAQFSYGNRRPSETDTANLQIKQFSRAELFFLPEGESSRVVLLPPYVVELNNKIEHIKEKMIIESAKTHNDSIRKLIKIAGSDKKIKMAMEEYQKNKKIPAALLADVQALLESEVRNLLFLISEIASDGINIIQNLLLGDNPSVVMTSSKWPALSDFVQQIVERPLSEWNDRFRKARPNPESTSSNQYDSKAIDLVLSLNEHLIGKGELVVIVSDAPTMKRVLTKNYSSITSSTKRLNYIYTKTDGVSIQIPGFDSAIPIFRPVEMFYYLAILRAETDISTLENIKFELFRIDQLSILGESVKKILTPCEVCVKNGERFECSLLAGCRNKGIQLQLSEHGEYFDKYINVLLAENRFSTLTPAWRKFTEQQDEFKKKLGKAVFELVEYLSFPQKDLEKQFKKTEKHLQNLMETEQLKALTLITDLTSAMHRDDIAGNLKKITRTRYRIHFMDKEIATLLNELEASRYTLGKGQQLSQIVVKLISYAYKKEDTSEKMLLWAILLLCHRLYGQAVGLVNRMLPDIEEEYAFEYYYVRALAYFLDEDYTGVAGDFDENADIYSADSRFYNLYALAISREIQKDLDVDDFSWHDAIKYAMMAREIAIKNDDDPSLIAAIANNIAYFLYCRNEPGDIERAQEYLNELQKLTRSFEEMPEYINTAGCIYKALALIEMDISAQKKYKIIAIQSLERAYELAKETFLDEKEVEEYKIDLYEAEEQLSNIL